MISMQPPMRFRRDWCRYHGILVHSLYISVTRGSNHYQTSLESNMSISIDYTTLNVNMISAIVSLYSHKAWPMVSGSKQIIWYMDLIKPKMCFLQTWK